MKKSGVFKKLSVITLVFMLMTLFPTGVFAAEAGADPMEEGQDQTVVFQIDQLGYQVGGQEISSDAAPYIKNDRTMIPVAFAAPALGSEPAEWLPDERMVIIKKGEHEVLIQIDSKELIVDGKTIMMDTAAEIKDIGDGGGRTMLPISFVARALEVGYEWQAETRSVYFYGYNKIYDQAGTYGSDLEAAVIQGNVIIKADGVKLQNLIVKGNLIIAEEVGQGTVTLDNITINGETLVRGGGPDSIYINGGQYNSIFIAKIFGKVRIVAFDAEGTAVILTEETGDNEVILEGSFDSVMVLGKGITLTTQGETNIKALNIEEAAENTSINLSSQTIVEEALLNTQADIENQGRIISAVGPLARASAYNYNQPENFKTRRSSSGGGGSSTPQAATPTFDPEAGEVAAGTGIVLSTATAGASIYYTSDGSTPSSSSPLYEGPITLNESVTIKAIAVKSGYRDSNIAAAIYTVLTVTNDFAGGDGTEADPYQVATAEQLDKVRDHLDKHFVQTAHIDLGVSPWKDEEGWVPIGSRDRDMQFTGTFDGNDYEITGLSINRPEGDYQGLFGYTQGASCLRNISLRNVDIKAGYNSGGIVAENYGTVSGCYVSGQIRGNDYIGGLVAKNNGTVIGCYASGQVEGNGYIGGLVGRNDITVSKSCASCSVMGKNYAGGLVGQNWGKISDCYASGSVSGSGKVGGLLGENSSIASVVRCYASGSVTGSSDVGGLVGSDGEYLGVGINSFYDSETSGQSDEGKGTPKTTEEMVNADIFNNWNFESVWAMDDSPVSYPYLQWQTDNIPYPPSDFAGGAGTEEYPYQVATAQQLDNVRNHLNNYFIQTANIDLGVSPWNDGEGWVPIGSRAYDDEPIKFTGTYDGNDYKITGLTINRPDTDYQGLFGCTGSSAELSNVSLEEVNIHAKGSVGGLVGLNDCGTIRNSSVSGSVTGEYEYVGELVGDNLGTISESNTSGSVVGGSRYVGGLAGRNWQSGRISKSYASGSVRSSGTEVGGLVGDNDGTINSSYASAAVTGNSTVGGLVAHNWENGRIKDSYASGSVTSSNIKIGRVGGLVGFNEGPINSSYASGSVTDANNAGGLIGVNNETGTIINSYYDSETTGQSDTDKGIQKTTAEMVYEQTYIDWDFDDTWDIGASDNPTYPYLEWQDDNIPVAPVTPVDGFASEAFTENTVSFSFSAPAGATSVKVMTRMTPGIAGEMQEKWMKRPQRHCNNDLNRYALPV